MLPLLAVAIVCATPPSDAAMRRAAEAIAPALVRVEGPHGRGEGVVVARTGEVLTSAHFVKLASARVDTGKRAVLAKVLAADGRLAFAVVKLPAGSAHAAAVRLTPVEPGEWLLVVTPGRNGKPSVRLTRAVAMHGPLLEIAGALPVGAAVLDAEGNLVGLAVAKGAVSRAIGMAAVKAALARERR